MNAGSNELLLLLGFLVVVAAVIGVVWLVIRSAVSAGVRKGRDSDRFDG